MTEEETFDKLGDNPQKVYEEAIEILRKIANAILETPSDMKKRTLQKRNTIVSSKLLSVKGGAECLILMGFLENDTSFTMPTTVPLEQIQEFKTSLLAWQRSYERRLRQEMREQLNRKFEMPPIIQSYTNPFLRKIEANCQYTIQYEDKKLHARARDIIPIATLNESASQILKTIQEQMKKNELGGPNLSLQDALILELLRWFKEDFFEWVDCPMCERCGNETVYSHQTTDSKSNYIDKVEVYRCKNCTQFTRFPRYNDLNILLDTRKGRCGEWANVFTLFCRSMGWETRYVMDETDHVWTEVYSTRENRWLHCDPCENACDTPLMYESGWGKKISYVMAYSSEEVQDVTWRYSGNHAAVLKRRRHCTEQELIKVLMEMRLRMQKDLPDVRKEYLTKRLVGELTEFLVEKKPNSDENKGRISGSQSWRLARGEMQIDSPPSSYVWQLSPDDVTADTVTIRYSSALDNYQCISGDRVLREVNGWQAGAYNHSGVFRKVESDWKMVYLARKEGTSTGTITWKIDLTNTKKKIKNVSAVINHDTYQNGIVGIKISTEILEIPLPKGERNAVLNFDPSCQNLTLTAELSGGEGDVAWQHAQLFRESIDNKDFTLTISLTLE